ncbi:hypothetical protein ACIQTZ_11645 [Paenarthrobacter sp. NPDC090520]|uniref:hypothetical protein n=1 Tax=Paenarthrobacter sp. NPDC090520 TaxID=3364382 RepID=UPI003822DAA8
MDTTGSPRHRTPKHATLASKALMVLFIGIVLTVSGCSIPGLPGPTGAPAAEQVEPAAAVTPAPEPQPTTPATPTITGEMASGALTHKLGAAGNQLVIDYWTDENPRTWTAERSPVIRLSATVTGSTEKTTIKVTRFNARIDSTSTTLANDTGDFAVDAPHSYTSSIVIPGDASAVSTRVLFTFDLLTETSPHSGTYTRQTVVDTLTLQFAVPVSPTPAPTSATNQASP